MKPNQRRESGCYPYYKVAIWNARSLCWHDTKQGHATEQSAREFAATFGPGRYRISEVDEHGRLDREPFEVNTDGGGR